MPKKRIILVALVSVVALLLVTGAEAEAPGVGKLPPYIGIVKNNTKYLISVPSENSMGTLLLPGREWIEFVVWDPQFNFIGYHEGEPFHCEKVTVTPDAVPYMCKDYDFLVEINPPTLPPKYYKKYKKRYRKKRT